MRDQALERKIRLLNIQLDNWKKLHDLITYGLDKAKPIISTEQEHQFIELRANLLQETEHILGELKILADLSGKTMNVLQRAVSMRAVRELPNDEVRRLENDWNAVFTQGNAEKVGRPDCTRLLFRAAFSPPRHGPLKRARPALLSVGSEALTRQVCIGQPLILPPL